MSPGVLECGCIYDGECLYITAGCAVKHDLPAGTLVCWSRVDEPDVPFGGVAWSKWPDPDGRWITGRDGTQ